MMKMAKIDFQIMKFVTIEDISKCVCVCVCYGLRKHFQKVVEILCLMADF